MGQVYLATDTLLARPVAIKVIAAFEPSLSARERFLVEARAAARLNHPNVAGIYRVGDIDGRPYLVTEFVPGRSLNEVEHPVPEDRALQICLGIARGLAEAHRHGVLHRDIKPANVILTKDGTAKLVDFGLAKLLDDRPEHRRPLPTTGSLPAPPAISENAVETPAQPTPAPNELGLAERIELKPLAIRCPSSPAIEFARDDANRLHLLGLGAEAAPDLLAAEGWARTNASLVLPAAGLTREAEIVVRVLTATPSRDRKLLDGRFRVDLLREVRVGDDTAWCCVPLNADE